MKKRSIPKSYTRLYNIWRGMKQRCCNPNNSHYYDYGGRGITVCDEWLHDFDAFESWAKSHGYKEDLTIDRIDNNKGYSPNNCQWITRSQNSAKRGPRTYRPYTEYKRAHRVWEKYTKNGSIVKNWKEPLLEDYINISC